MVVLKKDLERIFNQKLSELLADGWYMPMGKENEGLDGFQSAFEMGLILKKERALKVLFWNLVKGNQADRHFLYENSLIFADLERLTSWSIEYNNFDDNEIIKTVYGYRRSSPFFEKEEQAFEISLKVQEKERGEQEQILGHMKVKTDIKGFKKATFIRKQVEGKVEFWLMNPNGRTIPLTEPTRYYRNFYEERRPLDKARDNNIKNGKGYRWYPQKAS